MQHLSAVLLFLVATLIPVLGCDWLKHYDHFTNESLTRLRLMGAEMSHNDLSFPYKFYSHIRNSTVESQLIFIRDSLQLIEGLYHHNRSSVAWDTKKTDEFLMLVDRQRDEISSCISTRRRTGQWLRKYYKTLQSTLGDMGGSSASWEMIRKVTDDHLYQLNLLVHFMVKQQKN